MKKASDHAKDIGQHLQTYITNVSLNQFVDDLTPMVEAIQRQTLRDVAAIIEKKEKDVYVGTNPLREGIRRGLVDAELAVFDCVCELSQSSPPPSDENARPQKIQA